MTSQLVEDNSSKYTSEEEGEDERGGDEEDVPLKEEPCVQKRQPSWAPSFFYRLEKEMYHFVGQDILIQEALDSYAASTWPAAPALCEYLESHRKELDLVDKAVLEIGSGTGLVSIVAALLGAWVTATDLPDTLSNLRLNLSRNTRGKCRHTPQVAALTWSFDLERTYPTSVYHYDYVLAADVVYHHKFLDELLATMKHFCHQGTKILWANKFRMVNDTEFAGNFRKTFNTKLVFEDGDMRIFMATRKEDEEEENEEEEEDKPKYEIQMEDGLEKSESEDFMSKNEATVMDTSYNKELFDGDDGDDEEYEDDEEEDEEEEGEEESEENLNEETGDSKEDIKGQSLENDDTLKANKGSEEIVTVDDDEEDEDEEDEEDSGDEDLSTKDDECPDPDSKEDTVEEEQKVKTFSWTVSVISSFGKDTYHYVGTDINIYECIDFEESVDPYGTVLWPGALALCSFLENNRDLVNLEDKEVLELGSGIGLVAIVASLLGAKVTATDLPNVLGNLQANVMRNTRGRSKHLPQICPLTWSFDIGRIYPSHLHQFDFVLAADVVYHHKYLDELLATMSHFCHPRTTIIWSNKIRIVTDIQFTEKFKKEFNTTVLAEDGDMKIYMGKFKI